ncbi:unnamed protein product [Nippostrongylus brasiliensis]|uniref:GRIP domain-containing protein n=1 Tax=Nippostrongylus brasiliensis TaxID=27835 RepID=A0A0N4XLJ6_NIPBR|nr:unnamed protein product [Nippostrongylus brasiliensis]
MSSLLSAVSKFKGRKRGLVDLASPTLSEEKSMAAAIAELSEDQCTRQHIKTILAYLLESQEKVGALMAENGRLYE